MAIKMNLTVREKKIRRQKTNILKGKEDEMVPKYKLNYSLKQDVGDCKSEVDTKTGKNVV